MDTEIAGIPVKIIKKDIKNMHLYVKPPDGHVVVSAPRHLSEESILMFVRTRLGWIKKQQEKFLAQPRQTERQFVSGETMYIWGKQYFLQEVFSESLAVLWENPVSCRARITLYSVVELLSLPAP